MGERWLNDNSKNNENVDSEPYRSGCHNALVESMAVAMLDNYSRKVDSPQ